MPKAPILSREGLYKKLPDGTIVMLDWNLVNTNVGVMLEQRQFGFCRDPLAATFDAHEAGYSRLSEVDENYLQFTFSHGGQTIPTTFTP